MQRVVLHPLQPIEHVGRHLGLGELETEGDGVSNLVDLPVCRRQRHRVGRVNRPVGGGQRIHELKNAESQEGGAAEEDDDDADEQAARNRPADEEPGNGRADHGNGNDEGGALPKSEQGCRAPEERSQQPEDNEGKLHEANLTDLAARPAPRRH